MTIQFDGRVGIPSSIPTQTSLALARIGCKLGPNWANPR
jgi:hypothetical protein